MWSYLAYLVTPNRSWSGHLVWLAELFTSTKAWLHLVRPGHMF